jgi:hypothetical protein
MMMMRVCLAALAAAVAWGGGASCDYKNDRFRIENVGASGKFAVYPLDTDGKDTGTSLKISMAKMEEKTAAGGTVQQHKITGWASKDFTWECKTCAYTSRNEAGAEEEHSDACSTFVLTETVDSKAVKIRVTTWLYDADTTFVIKCPNGTNVTNTTNCTDQIVPVKGEGAKFTVQIADWPFAAKENKLHFGITIQSSGAAHGGDDKRRRLKTVDAGGFQIESPDTAVVDHGDNTGSNIDVDVQSTTSGTKVDIDYVFDSFEGAMEYDPTVAVAGVAAAVVALL